MACTMDSKDQPKKKVYKIMLKIADQQRLEHDYSGAEEWLEPTCSYDNTQDTENAEMNTSETEDNHKFSCSYEQEQPGFRWPHAAILLLVEEFRKHQGALKKGKVSHKKVWAAIARVMEENGYPVTGPQCQSKFSGMKKTYRNITKHNEMTAHPTRSWPYMKLMDDLIDDKPAIPSVEIFSNDSRSKRVRTDSESSSESNDNTRRRVPKKPRKNLDVHELLQALDQRREKAEARKEKRQVEKQKQIERRHRENLERQDRFLNLMEQLINKL